MLGIASKLTVKKTERERERHLLLSLKQTSIYAYPLSVYKSFQLPAGLLSGFSLLLLHSQDSPKLASLSSVSLCLSLLFPSCLPSFSFLLSLCLLLSLLLSLLVSLSFFLCLVVRLVVSLIAGLVGGTSWCAWKEGGLLPGELGREDLFSSLSLKASSGSVLLCDRSCSACE